LDLHDFSWSKLANLIYIVFIKVYFNKDIIKKLLNTPYGE